jgi:DNA replication protein DnaC
LFLLCNYVERIKERTSSLSVCQKWGNVATLAVELREAKDGYQLRKKEKSIANADLLLLDELSYASFNREESELLFKVIATFSLTFTR